jgi:hypothetical protein
MNNIQSNFALFSQLLTLGYDGLNARIVNLFKQITGNPDLRISKTIADDSAFDVRSVKTLTEVNFFKGAQLLNGTNQPEGYIRPEAEHLLILSISFFDSDSAAAVYGAIAFNRGVTLEEVANGYLTISSNNNTYLDSQPMLNYLYVAEQAASGTYHLKEPIPWQAQTSLVANLSCPVAIAATNNAYVGIQLNGIGLV